MKRIVCVIILCIVLVLLYTGCQTNKTVGVSEAAAAPDNILTIQDKIDDFEYMYKILEENYPFFEVNKRVSGIDWLANKEKYKDMINLAMTDQLYYDTLNKVLADLNNKHTSVIDQKFYHYSKDNLETDPVMYKAWLEQLNAPEALERYGEKVKKAEISNSTSSDGGSNIIEKNIQTKVLVADKVAYLEIKSLNYFNIEPDIEIIKPFIKSISGFDAFIIDIRQNGGGSTSYWSNHIVPMLINKPASWNNYFLYRGGSFSEPFIEGKLRKSFSELKSIDTLAQEGLSVPPPELYKDFKYYHKSQKVIEPREAAGFKGKVYLLVDNMVYSSSEAFASFAQNTDFATLIGETMGGDGIGQEPLFCTLPNSGYVVRFPMVMGLTHDGTCNEEYKTVPDIKVPAEKNEDFNKDEAIQYVLNLYK